MAPTVLLVAPGKRRMNKQRIVSALCSALIAIGVSAGSVNARQNTSAKAPDNTSVNKRDKSQSEPNADQSKNNLSDRQLAANIRRDVIHDKNLSTYGHNVKIIADHGNVTLKGPVHSDDEKRAIEEHARKYVGEDKVKSELAVKEEQSKHE